MSLIQELEDTLNITPAAAGLEAIEHPLLHERDIRLLVKRDDKLHPVISGNKWRKLKYIIAHALQSGYDHLISMGGAYSNHLHALAYIGHRCTIKTTGLIRGEPDDDNPTFKDLQRWGMRCEFVDRSSFRRLRTFKHHASQPARDYGGYWIPEGGACPQALPGIGEMVYDIGQDFDYISVACGTGTTLAGIIQTLPANARALGFSVLKENGFIAADIQRLIGPTPACWDINNHYHFGGFARSRPELLRFIDEFSSLCGIPLEPVYTGKLLYGLFDLLASGFFHPGQTVAAYHSGGLQGIRSNLPSSLSC